VPASGHKATSTDLPDKRHSTPEFVHLAVASALSAIIYFRIADCSCNALLIDPVGR